MQKLGELNHFQEKQNIILQGFDPVSAGGFTQVPNVILNNPDLSSNAKIIYSKLLSYAWNNNHVFPGQERLAQDTGISLRTVVTTIKELSKTGYLEVTRRGLGKTNVYILKFFVKEK
jgi:hypothetical protein